MVKMVKPESQEMDEGRKQGPRNCMRYHGKDCLALFHEKYAVNYYHCTDSLRSYICNGSGATTKLVRRSEAELLCCPLHQPKGPATKLVRRSEAELLCCSFQLQKSWQKASIYHSV